MGSTRERLRLLIVAGESSGDLHAASLIQALRDRVPKLEVVAVGGDKMAQAGAELLYHQRHLAVVGITEVLAHLADVRRALRTLEVAAVQRQVDAVVLVDYPDFNMTLARRLRRVRPHLPIIYYISPQVWAWRSGRVGRLARLVDQMLVILPFEKALYEGAGVRTDFVGHPLLDAIGDSRSRGDLSREHGLDARLEWVGLLPGSRRAEIERLLPVMLEAGVRLARERGCELLIPRAPGLPEALYDGIIQRLPADVRPRVHRITGDYYDLLSQCRGAVVCSGTATLEAALVGTPEVVVYRTSWLTYNLGKLLVRIQDIALVNVIAAERGVPELLQHEVTAPRIVEQLVPLLEEGEQRRQCRRFLRDVRARLGQAGASGRAAAAILEQLGRRTNTETNGTQGEP